MNSRHSASKPSRRDFLHTTLAAAAALSLPSSLSAQSAPAITAAKLPRWRGFNLLEKFTARRHTPFREEDFAIIAEWGFNFVRLPLSYHCWANPNDWLNLNQTVLKDIDQAVSFGQKYKVHVNLNFHRAPGYCVNPPAESLDLWTNETAQDACAFHWRHFAKRYKGIPNTAVSFDLINEPSDLPEDAYTRVVRRLVEAIRLEDPNRLIIADGLKWGQQPVYALVDLGIAQSTRGYRPMQISHYRASWIQGQENWPSPAWPLKINDQETWDRQRLHDECIKPWKDLAAKGVGVHVGEWGAFQYTPHKVALAWMRDCLDLWKDAGWGWSLWNLRGPFGVLNSNRTDVQYETFKGLKLDRQMLQLLQTA